MDKKEAQREFTLRSLREAINRTVPELRVASAASHKHCAEVEDDDDSPGFDKVIAVGLLVGALDSLCGPHVWVLNEVARALYELHDHEEEEEEQEPHQHPQH